MGPSTCSVSVYIQDAAGTSKDYYATPPFAGEWKLVSAVFIPDGDGAVAVDATDIREILVKNGSTTLGTLTTDTDGSETALVAGTPVDISLSGGKSLEFTGKTDAVLLDSNSGGGTGKVGKGVMILGFEKLARDSA